VRKFYKYRYGYINVDADCLYLTNSGNWSETKQLIEKSFETSLTNGIRKTRMIGYIVVSSILLGGFLLMNLASSKISVFLLILIPAGIYQVYRTLITEAGPRYLIPLEKIETIEEKENGITILFKNKRNEPASQFIENIKGFELEIIMALIKERKLNGK
jgi:hypothetical protein